jgi:hypothetical protein
MKAHPRPISRVAQRTLAHYATATHCQQPVQDEKPTYKRKKKMIKKGKLHVHPCGFTNVPLRPLYFKLLQYQP